MARLVIRIGRNRPMALGLGEAGHQAAPLGRAVIGGLAAATAATLLFLPACYTLLQQRAGRESISLDPDDPESRFYHSESATPESAHST
jgi:Cu/Ag efflux pump CusA